MRLRHTLTITALTLTCLAFTPSARAQDATSRIAIADPVRIFNEMQETKDLRQKMEGDRQNLANTEREKRTKIKDLQDARDQLKPDSPQYAERNKEWVNANIDLEVWGRLQQLEVQRTQKQQMKTMYEKIAAATTKVAQRHNLDLVIAAQRPDIPDDVSNPQLTVDALRAVINTRNILYSNGKADLSNEVIAQLDADYRANPNATPVTPVTPVTPGK